jgi:hypothetical protein
MSRNDSEGWKKQSSLADTNSPASQTNIQIFQIVLNLQNVITRIPGQLERQQPVYVVDAIGRHMPFLLEFVLSAEASSIVFYPGSTCSQISGL